MVEAFRQDLVTRITGLNARTLRRLERLRIVTPSVAPREEGWPPLYSFTDVMRLKIAAELLEHDYNAPQIRQLVDDLEARGFPDALVQVEFWADEPEPDERRYVSGMREARGRVFIRYPDTDEARSGHNLDQRLSTYDLNLRHLRTNLRGTIDELTQRRTGDVEKVRGVQSSAYVVVGTRVPTRLIGRLARAGWTADRILQSYPHLTAEDIEAALKHEGVEAAIA